MAAEATLTIWRLHAAKEYSRELHEVAWDAVLNITEALQEQIEVNYMTCYNCCQNS